MLRSVLGWNTWRHSTHGLGSTATVLLYCWLKQREQQNRWSFRFFKNTLLHRSQDVFCFGGRTLSRYLAAFCFVSSWEHFLLQVFWLAEFRLNRLEQITHLGSSFFAFTSLEQICPQTVSLPSVKNFRPQFAQILIVNDYLVIPSILVK